MVKELRKQVPLNIWPETILEEVKPKEHMRIAHLRL